jgi:hypothetical protein
MLRTALFWVIVQRATVISYGRFRTTCQSYLQGLKIQKEKLLFLKSNHCLSVLLWTPVLYMTHNCILNQVISEYRILEDASNKEILHADCIILGYNCNLDVIKNTLPPHCYNYEIQDHLLSQDPKCLMASLALE